MQQQPGTTRCKDAAMTQYHRKYAQENLHCRIQICTIDLSFRLKICTGEPWTSGNKYFQVILHVRQKICTGDLYFRLQSTGEIVLQVLKYKLLATALSSRKNAQLPQDLWFIFNLRNKGLVTYIHTVHYYVILCRTAHQLLTVQTYLSGYGVERAAANEYILASFQKQTDTTSSLSHAAGDALIGFPCCRLGLAWPSLACLDLSVDPKSQISNTYKSSQIHITARIMQIAQEYLFRITVEAAESR